MSRPISRPSSAPLLFDPMSSNDHITYIPTPEHRPTLSYHLPIRTLYNLRLKYGTQTYLLTGLGIVAICVIIMSTWLFTPSHDNNTVNHGITITSTTPTSQPGYTNTSMEDENKRMRVGVTLSMWGPPDIASLSRFLRSMHISIPPSDIINNITLILLIGMNDDIQDIHYFKSIWEHTLNLLQTIHENVILSYYNLKKVNDGRIEPNPVLTRFIAIPEYMQHHRHEYDILLVADARDLIFQGDPFEQFLVMIEQRKSLKLPKDKYLLGEPLLSPVDHLAPDDPARANPAAYRQHLLSTQHILLAWESQTIAESAWNSRVIRNGYGIEELNKIQHEMISCSGTIIGHVDLVMRYCQELYLHGLTAHTREMFGLDQSSHMHLLYTRWINLEHQVMLTDYNDGIIHTIGVLSPNQVHVDQFGRVRDGEGHIPAIVHQFDRFPELVHIIEGQYPYHPDGYPITKTLVDTTQGVHAHDPTVSNSN